jgi:hypothetical protein
MKSACSLKGGKDKTSSEPGKKNPFMELALQENKK